jgi:hypothetical protein
MTPKKTTSAAASSQRRQPSRPKKKLSPEAVLQAAVIKMCSTYPDLAVVRLDPGHRSQRGVDNSGFPDLAIFGPGGILFRELKSVAGYYRGPRPSQTTWKHRLLAAHQDYEIWTPADLDSGRVADELDALAVFDPTDTAAEFSRVMARG